MRKVIQGKIYDTEKSHLIGEADANCSPTDFSYWEAGLYRTPRSGRYFLAGHGGPMTSWGQPVQGGMGGGSGIRPLDPEHALEWAEQHLDTEIVEKEFNDMIEEA